MVFTISTLAYKNESSIFAKIARCCLHPWEFGHASLNLAVVRGLIKSFYQSHLSQFKALPVPRVNSSQSAYYISACKQFSHWALASDPMCFCLVGCTFSGQMTRSRVVLQPAGEGGRPCPSQLSQTRPCPIRPCYSWILGDWRPCRVEVVLMQHTRLS